MHRIIILLSITFFLFSCNNQGSETAENSEGSKNSTNKEVPEGWMSRGDTISPENAMDISAFRSAMEGKKSMEAKVKTEINSNCKKKGCWMKVNLGEGEEMRVTFKDYGFFVPLDAEGKDVIMKGKAYYDTTSVEMLKHYAEDAGASQAAIDSITSPKLELAFEATGVLLK